MCAAISPNPNESIGRDVSRSGRVRKKSSLLADYESLDGFEKPKKHGKEKPIKREKNVPTPKVTLKIGGEPRIPGKRGPKKGMKRMKLEAYNMKRSMLEDEDDDDEGDLEIDLPDMKYDMDGHLPMLASEEIIDEGLLDEEDGATEIAENTSINRLKSQAESTYFMEKKLETSRKYGAIHPGVQSGKIKQTRKDKGSPRVTAYMLWAKEQRPHIVRKHPDVDNPTIAKKLGDLWSTVPPNQKKLWKSKASKLMKKKANLGENMKNSARESRPPGRPGRKPKIKIVQEEESSSSITKSSTITSTTINTTSTTSSNVIIPNSNKIKKFKQPKEVKGMKKKSATASLSTNSTLSNKTPKIKASPKGSTTTTTPTATIATTNGKPMNRGVFPKSSNNNKHNSITHTNRNFTPKGRQSPKTAPQTNKNNSGINHSNNFALVSSEFTQQTNVQINKNDKKFSANKNNNNNVNLSTMQTSSPSSSRFLQSSPSKSQFSPRKEEDSNMYKVTNTAPLDVAAHFSLLGESLTIIGERLKEHEGQTVSGSLSVLLDSLLSATGPLLCLTQQVPSLNAIPPEQLASILDNIAYIMPGL